MGRARRSAAALLMLLSLLMGVGAYACNYSKWLAHEVVQGTQQLVFVKDPARLAQVSASDDGKPLSLNDAQHQLVHTVDHGQPPLLSSLPPALGESPARAAPLPAYRLALIPSSGEPPFRPPRDLSRC